LDAGIKTCRFVAPNEIVYIQSATQLNTTALTCAIPSLITLGTWTIEVAVAGTTVTGPREFTVYGM